MTGFSAGSYSRKPCGTAASAPSLVIRLSARFCDSVGLAGAPGLRRRRGRKVRNPTAMLGIFDKSSQTFKPRFFSFGTDDPPSRDALITGWLCAKQFPSFFVAAELPFESLAKLCGFSSFVG